MDERNCLAVDFLKLGTSDAGENEVPCSWQSLLLVANLHVSVALEGVSMIIPGHASDFLERVDVGS